MVEICLEQGVHTYEELQEQGRRLRRSSNKLGKLLSDMGVSDSIVDQLIYKDKLNHLIIWYCGIFVLLILFLIIYKL